MLLLLVVAAPFGLGPASTLLWTIGILALVLWVVKLLVREQSGLRFG